MTTTYTLTGKFIDVGLDVIAGTKIVATVGTNLARLGLIDLDDDLTGLPRPKRLSVADDGSFSIDLIGTNSTGINVLDGTLRYIVRAEYPDGHGGKINWDSGFFELTANADLSDKAGTDVAIEVSEATAMVSTLVEQAVQDHTPGIDLGVASRTSNFTTTAVASSDTAGNIPSLVLNVVGQGRPIDIRFHCPSVRHSVANTTVSAVIIRDGNVTSADNQIGAVKSASTTDGPSMTIVRRTGVLVAGTPYVFNVRVWGAAAGTCTLVGAAYCPIELTATSR